VPYADGFPRFLKLLVQKHVVTRQKPTVQVSITKILSVYQSVNKQTMMQQPGRVIIGLTLCVRIQRPLLTWNLFCQQLIR